MKEAEIFFIDLNPSNKIGRDLRVIIDSCPRQSFNLYHESPKEVESNFLELELSQIIKHRKPDLIFLNLPPNHLKQSKALFKSLKKEHIEVPIILIVEACDPDEMISLLKLGAADFITPPIKKIDILPRLWRLLERKNEEKTMTFKLKETLGLKQLIGESSTFLKEIRKIPKMAKCDVSILITGETGTGKELCARAIHYLSPRASKPFIPFNCGTIPTELMENELFGHVKGAFTGASDAQSGLICEANSGTVFLDDIDCLPLASQAKLLRFLQEKEFRQLGSAKTCFADVRIITATNADLEDLVKQGKLRQDLYYRLNVIPLMLPALRNRREDILLLSQHFLSKYSTDFNKQLTGFAPEAEHKLILYDWPGNVRELEHVVERAVLFSEQDIIRENDIILPQQEVSACIESFKEAKANIVNEFEKNYIENLLLAYKGNITKAAQAAQKDRRSFWQLIQKHEMDVQNYRTG